MPLFQKTVTETHLKTLDATLLDQKWQAYQAHFLNPEIRQNIRNAKEEQYQEGFLQDLFVHILGYTKNPSPGYNLTTELKNVTNSKKADGAVILNGQVRAVIELKGTSTTDLNSVVDQAFGYKNNQPGCRYVIVSNFEKLRLYIDYTTEHIEFDLFALDETAFALLYLCLCYESMQKDVPLLLKEQSIGQENCITRIMYRDYSAVRHALFANLRSLNPQYPPLLLFRKTQKLLDRFLFLLFAEDRQLLPPNSVRLILDDWQQLKDRDAYIPLYRRYQKYFQYLNEGYQGKRYEVYPYNGGLFRPDEVLDAVLVDDELLYRHTRILADYDFASEVDVNILGHIFENSLNEIEEIEAQLAGRPLDKTQTKRKKDGIFYTPRYITKYMVEQTVGSLCAQKRAEHGITETDYVPDKKRNKKHTQALEQQIANYRSWLLQLTILDPACGSGAFLNEALDYLLREHAYLDALLTKLQGGVQNLFPNIERSILENNLYGVDLNEESVEIAKLALWLRTAQPKRKLNDLSGNLKCGNSLIDDPAVAGEKAFDWHREFPQVFEKGGFDIVIGNPPYVRKQGLVEHYPEMCTWYEQHYRAATANYDLYTLFMERSLVLIRETGLVSFILPHKFLIADFGVGIRELLAEARAARSILHFGSEMVFADASTYTCIIHLDKTPKTRLAFQHLKPLQTTQPFGWDQLDYTHLSKENWNLHPGSVARVMEKLHRQPHTVGDVFPRIFQGIATSLDAVYVFEGTDQGDHIAGYNAKYDHHFRIEKELVKPFVKGDGVARYAPLHHTLYVLFPYKDDGMPVEEVYIQERLPQTYTYLKHYESQIRGRENGKMNIQNGWYLYIDKKNVEKFPNPKIMTQEISHGC
ncbi:MAG: Eco57I restriction-modification methylase domain-containing protein, partial [Sphingobacteriia bacterium]